MVKSHSVARQVSAALLACLGIGGVFSSVAYAAETPVKSHDTGSIFGKVADATGTSVAGVQITLYRLHQPAGPRWGRWKPAVAMVASNEAGDYEFGNLSEGIYMPSARKDGFAPVFCQQRYIKNEPLQADIVLKMPAEPVIQVTDQAGRPVAGARVREYWLKGASGESYLSQLALRSLGLTIAASDSAGRLQLPALPEGDRLTVTIDHPRFAPIRLADIEVRSGIVANAAMKPGVTLTLRIPTDDPGNRIKSAVIDLRREPIDRASTVVHYEADFDEHGEAHLSVEAGDYQCLLLQHADFFITPSFTEQSSFHIGPGCNDLLQFQVHRKMLCRGRVVDADTGELIRDVDLMGEIASGEASAPPADKWSFAENAKGNDDGTYSIKLAAGLARIGFFGAKSTNVDQPVLDAESLYAEFEVATDGSTVIPDIRVRRLPRFTGIVRNPDGCPAAKAVVRFAGRFQPVLADTNGRFEIQPNWIPIDAKTGERQYNQRLIAFDPYRPLAARVDVQLDKPTDLALTLEPHPIDWPLEELDHPAADSARLAVAVEEAEQYANISLRGRPAPELEGAAWINTDGKPLTLDGLRGNYVLLDFWMIPCAPCHADFPSVKLAHELYKDRGLVVIGVHNNAYGSVDEVREHVAKISLPFPVVVDFPNERTIAKYQRHGIAKAYPHYVLIGPDGKVLLDDRTIASPRRLHGYKLEIIRKFLLESPPAEQSTRGVD